MPKLYEMIGLARNDPGQVAEMFTGSIDWNRADSAFKEGISETDFKKNLVEFARKLLVDCDFKSGVDYNMILGEACLVVRAKMLGIQIQDVTEHKLIDMINWDRPNQIRPAYDGKPMGPEDELEARFAALKRFDIEKSDKFRAEYSKWVPPVQAIAVKSASSLQSRQDAIRQRLAELKPQAAALKDRIQHQAVAQPVLQQQPSQSQREKQEQRLAELRLHVAAARANEKPQHHAAKSVIKPEVKTSGNTITLGTLLCTGNPRVLKENVRAEINRVIEDSLRTSLGTDITQSNYQRSVIKNLAEAACLHFLDKSSDVSPSAMQDIIKSVVLIVAPIALKINKGVTNDDRETAQAKIDLDQILHKPGSGDEIAKNLKGGIGQARIQMGVAAPKVEPEQSNSPRRRM